LVLMSVFLPAAFLPGLTGRMYAQFALVIAATALLSAINAATLKPTQSAMWLRPAVPPEQRNIFYRSFNRVYERIEYWYASLIAHMVSRSVLMVAAALALIAATGYWFSRVPTGFLPLEDQGYMIALVQLPDGAALERTQKTLDKVFEIARKTPGVARVVNIAGVSALDNSATLSSAGVAYIILKDWSERGEGEDLMSLFNKLNADLAAIPEADILVMPPPPDPGRRQRRRLYHAGRVARRQLRHGQAAKRHQRDRCQRQDAVRPAAGIGLVPLERSAVQARSRPGEDGGAASVD
jgi:hydrophobic/amphiphilic exporter-1 (mainly G- bacteria), HAE1 family